LKRPWPKKKTKKKKKKIKCIKELVHISSVGFNDRFVVTPKTKGHETHSCRVPRVSISPIL
jgi:ribosomal protein S11